MKGLKALSQESALDLIPKKKIKWKPLSWICLVIVFIPIVAYFVFNGFPVVLSFISIFTDMENNDFATMTWERVRQLCAGISGRKILEVLGRNASSRHVAVRHAAYFAYYRRFTRTKGKGRKGVAGFIFRALHMFERCRSHNVGLGVF